MQQPSTERERENEKENVFGELEEKDRRKRPSDLSTQPPTIRDTVELKVTQEVAVKIRVNDAKGLWLLPRIARRLDGKETRKKGQQREEVREGLRR